MSINTKTKTYGEVSLVPSGISISVKYLPPTDSKGSRMKVQRTDKTFPPKVFSYQYENDPYWIALVQYLHWLDSTETFFYPCERTSWSCAYVRPDSKVFTIIFPK